MEKETAERTSDRSTGSNAEIGAITKGSSGPGHATRAHQTTSTGSPATPVSREFWVRLSEMHDAEEQLAKALFIMENAAKSPDLKTLLGVHLKETEAHARSLEELAATNREELCDKECRPVRDMISEAEKALAKSLVNSTDRDGIIIDAGRKAEQFEISEYARLCAIAEGNNWTHENAVLTSILHQEKLAEELLAGLAEGKESLHELIEKVTLAHAKSGG
jgi:ferritin-like metal-binding protein YciE